ncbi:MAG: twin-arginine translocase TatA/TatE family subunit [Deltaproteobacteria bacterium]|nr:twin-arginine translocase TatA/TatE family subunit [Deltaproteobacteria bacterium]
MFGMGGSEILVILIVALLFLGPDKLPDAAKTISKGIRDLKKQTRVLQETIENDEHIGGAIRDLKSALNGEPEPRPVVRKPATPAKLPDGAVENQILPPTEAAAESPGGALPAAESPAAAPPASAPAAPIAGAPEPAASAPDVAAEPPAKPPITLPVAAGEGAKAVDDETAQELAKLIKPAAGTVAKS